MTFFKVEKLSISFGGIEALANISFEVKQGEIYAIIGPNGRGKLPSSLHQRHLPPNKGTIVSKTGKSRASGLTRSPNSESPEPFRT